MGTVVQEKTVDGLVEEHYFGDDGFDVWGYNIRGEYEGTYDRAPFQNSPFVAAKEG